MGSVIALDPLIIGTAKGLAMTVNDKISDTQTKGNKPDPDDWSKHRLSAPQKNRPGEVREGGYIVIERTPKKKLLRPASWPVEMDTLENAVIAARRLMKRRPEKEFVIFQQVGSFKPKR